MNYYLWSNTGTNLFAFQIKESLRFAFTLTKNKDSSRFKEQIVLEYNLSEFRRKR